MTSPIMRKSSIIRRWQSIIWALHQLCHIGTWPDLRTRIQSIRNSSVWKPLLLLTMQKIWWWASENEPHSPLRNHRYINIYIYICISSSYIYIYAYTHLILFRRNWNSFYSWSNKKKKKKMTPQHQNIRIFNLTSRWNLTFRFSWYRVHRSSI